MSFSNAKRKHPRMNTTRLKNDRSFNVLFSSESFAQLQELANVYEISAGAVIRRLVRAAFEMRFDQKPTCASGGPCLVPQIYFQSLGPNNERKP
jgi:hypothetical protein